MPRATDPPAEVRIGERTWQLAPQDRFSFGRADACTACLDPDDLGVSRRAGEVRYDDGHWWLHNRSRSRPLDVVDELGFRQVLAPGRHRVVEGELTVVVVGSIRRYAIGINVPQVSEFRPPAEGGPAGGDPALPTSVGTGVMVNEADRQALVALFSGYLQDFPRYDPHPRTYADASARLDWNRTTLVKRIEYLRSRLTNAGVPNLQGENALESLAEYVISTGIITKDDLALLD